jgi:ADP-L-glycero-D-manno-heptose 6-epimerase
MIIVTGAAGFIGSCLVGKLNNKGLRDIIIVDHFTDQKKSPNYSTKAFTDKVDRDGFPGWMRAHAKSVDFVFHLGAKTDTTEFNKDVFDRLNLNYSKSLWEICTENKIPLIYASSAATYGMGELGYSDDHSLVKALHPLNPYGESKNDFDKFVLEQDKCPPFWAGLKFFNVYGPNEYHKGRMASVVFHSYHQIFQTGKVRLFRSHHPDYENGMQLRDFIYVKDVIDVMHYLMKKQPESGLYNLGTGQARTFLDLAGAVFRSLNLEENIEFIDIPEDIRERYQNFTEAKMEKLRSAGYDEEFYTLDEGVEEYVQGYLMTGSYF